MTNSRPIEALRAVHESGRPHADTSSNQNPITETIYTDEIPAFVDATLERLYACVYCTLTRIEAYDSLQRICTYVRKDGSTITAIILFRVDKHIVSVVNQQISLSEAKLSSFCEAIFRTFKKSQVIKFYAIDANVERSSFPYQRLQAIEENIIYFPPSKEAYLAGLRRQFIKQLSNAAKKIEADYPSFKQRVVNRGDIIEADVVQILALAKKRMLSKGKEVYSEKIDRVALMKTLKKYGHVAMATIDGKVCAGSIFLSVGKKHFHQFIAHDPEYDQYMLGNQMWLTAILYSLELQGEECWLMGGARLHKSRFLAKPHTFDSITIYRSKFHAALNPRIFVYRWAKQQVRAFKASCKAEVENNTSIGRLIEKIMKSRSSPQSNKPGV